VKYEFAARQRHLPLHCDQSELSLTVALNAQDSFQAPSQAPEVQLQGESKGLPLPTYGGGGTFFESLGHAVVPEMGGLVAFPGELSHGGLQITRGEGAQLSWDA